MFRRHGGKIAALIVILVLAGALGSTSLKQNLLIRSYFQELFTAVQNKDEAAIKAFYTAEATNLNYDALAQFIRYPLYGWKMLSVTHQPWPMDATKGYRDLKVEFYMDLPADLVKPRGPYASLENSPYGPCAVVPVTVQFYYLPDNKSFFLMPPNAGSAKNWLCPFTPQATPPAPH